MNLMAWLRSSSFSGRIKASNCQSLLAFVCSLLFAIFLFSAVVLCHTHTPTHRSKQQRLPNSRLWLWLQRRQTTLFNQFLKSVSPSIRPKGSKMKSASSMAFSVPCCCCCCLCCSRLTAEQVENASFPLSFDVSSVFRLATLATPHPSPSRHPVLFCHLALFVSAAFTAAFMVFPPYALGHSICHLNMSQFSTFLPVAFNEPTAKVAPLSTPPSPFHFLSRSCLPLDFIMHSI